mmetsp:Transcript_86146/g.238765  ORF Transcript_86146/g.238765 Transcript_86146/m.238765 type:complete len:232 (-) Transcript_86146:3882-4577(-)
MQPVGDRVAEKDDEEDHLDGPHRPAHDRGHEEREAADVDEEQAEHQEGEVRVTGEGQDAEPPAAALDDDRRGRACDDAGLRLRSYPEWRGVPGAVPHHGRLSVLQVHVGIPAHFVVEGRLGGHIVGHVHLEVYLACFHLPVFHPEMALCKEGVLQVPIDDVFIEGPRREAPARANLQPAPELLHPTGLRHHIEFLRVVYAHLEDGTLSPWIVRLEGWIEAPQYFLRTHQRR